MAAPSTKTWAVGDVLTAADMNTYVRDAITGLPWGKIGLATDSARSGITASTILCSSTVTWGTGRRALIFGWVRFSTTAGTTTAVDFGAKVSGAFINAAATSIVNSTTAVSLDYVGMEAPSAGSRQYDLTIQPFGGSTIGTQGGTFLLVVDAGSA